MTIAALEETDRPDAPMPEGGPPEPKSFVEAARLHAAVQKELAAILASSSFRTSRKSCEFLSYVVQVALDGRMDSLKERSIGLDLLGRDISYDPSSDATVRVRANEVRKRLKSFYSTQPPRSGYRIELLPGSYSPRFVWDPNPAEIASAASLDIGAELSTAAVSEEPFPVLPLNIVGIMRPAFIALFICALFLRQQIQSGDPYRQFWDTRLQGKATMVVTDSAAKSEDTARAMLPIIWLGGRYDLKPLMRSQRVEGDDKQAGDAVVIHSTGASPPELAADTRLRYVISGSPGSLRLVDRLDAEGEVPGADDAAVLTVFPDHPSVLWIAGTDWESVNRLAERISSKDDFPSQLNVEAEAGRIVQLVVRGESPPRVELYAHQP